MMEVFLTFLFVVLTFSTVREVETADADEKLRRYRAQAESLGLYIDELHSHLDAMRRDRDQWRERFESEFPPRCPQRGRYLVVVTLVGNGQLEVDFREDLPTGQYRGGGVTRFSEQDFRAVFAPVLAQSEEARCRYTATIRDTPAVSKEELKRFQRVVKQYFYADLER